MQPLTGDPAADRPIPAPLVPLSAADLLVNARGEPALAHALAGEIPSADSIDLLCAFVRWHGLRVLLEPLSAHCRMGKPLRVVTTVYTGSTERKALDWLVNLGAQVKISYDTQSTRLHAKAWLFRRADRLFYRLHRLVKPVEVRAHRWRGVERPPIAKSAHQTCSEKFDATFESYWASTEYEDYVPDARCDCASTAPSAPMRQDSLDAPLLFLEVEPRPHQSEILEKLDAERKRHGRWKNLVVAATGTGKTIVAALDYKRLRQQSLEAIRRLLFVAHRQEILKQSLGAFRQVLRDGATSASSMSTARFRRNGVMCSGPFSPCRRWI